MKGGRERGLNKITEYAEEGHMVTERKRERKAHPLFVPLEYCLALEVRASPFSDTHLVKTAMPSLLLSMGPNRSNKVCVVVPA